MVSWFVSFACYFIQWGSVELIYGILACPSPRFVYLICVTYCVCKSWCLCKRVVSKTDIVKLYDEEDWENKTWKGGERLGSNTFRISWIRGGVGSIRLSARHTPFKQNHFGYLVWWRVSWETKKKCRHHFIRLVKDVRHSKMLSVKLVL